MSLLPPIDVAGASGQGTFYRFSTYDGSHEHVPIGPDSNNISLRRHVRASGPLNCKPHACPFQADRCSRGRKVNNKKVTSPPPRVTVSTVAFGNQVHASAGRLAGRLVHKHGFTVVSQAVGVGHIEPLCVHLKVAGSIKPEGLGLNSNPEDMKSPCVSSLPRPQKCISTFEQREISLGLREV